MWGVVNAIENRYTGRFAIAIPFDLEFVLASVFLFIKGSLPHPSLMLKGIYRIVESHDPKFRISPSECNRSNGGIVIQEHEVSKKLMLPEFFTINRYIRSMG